MTESTAPKAPVFATFVGELNQASAKTLTTKICLATQSGAPSLHLVLQSTGGGVSEGVFLHNFIKTLPIPITIYNIGSVCSAAVLAYLAAPKRQASKHASFMIHRVSTTQQGVDGDSLAAAVDSLKIDDERNDEILKAHLNLLPKQWKRYDRPYLWLTAQEGLKSGLVTDIGEFSPTAGVPIYDFGLS